MKSYLIYRNIRKEALIFGLPLTAFAIQMTSVIGSLLMIIFSFKVFLIFLILFWNLGLYIVLLHYRQKLSQIGTPKAFPGLISNRKPGLANEDY